MSGEGQQFIIRTEDIRPEHILDLYVETDLDRNIVAALKSTNPVVLEGSRGTGKSFLLRVAEAQISGSFCTTRVLPVYVSFQRSSLLQTGDPQQFLKWMMARMCSRIVRVLYEYGLLVGQGPEITVLSGDRQPLTAEKTRLERIADQYEDSYMQPTEEVDSTGIPTIESFRDAIEDVCRRQNINRFAVFFDEAAHIFRPAQQRQFFTLFRDLRSPYFTCNAAVYPGVTFYGDTFQPAHDATLLTMHRDPLDPCYLESMREMVTKQASSTLVDDIGRNGANFNALAYAASGNPRLLLKTVAQSGRLKTNDVEKALKEYLRTTIWSEHTELGNKYTGHRALVDWGRDFIEKRVIVDTAEKNASRVADGKDESTCYFWIHRDAPSVVNEALRLLCYTGIVTRLDSGIAGTRSEMGTRYALNLGCLVASDAKPIASLTMLGRTLSLKRFTEYGANHAHFTALASAVENFQEPDISDLLQRELTKSVDVLDITPYQRNGLRSIGINTVGEALRATEERMQDIAYIGPKRSRKMKNVTVTSVLEYLSG